MKLFFANANINTAGIYLLKVNSRDISKVWNLFIINNKDTKRRSGVFIVNPEHISHLVLVFLLLTSNM